MIFSFSYIVFNKFRKNHTFGAKDIGSFFGIIHVMYKQANTANAQNTPMKTNFTIDVTEIMGQLNRIEAMIACYVQMKLTDEEFQQWYDSFLAAERRAAALSLNKKESQI